MTHEQIFNYIIKHADVRELENILIAMQHASNLSPSGFAILSTVIKKAFGKELSPAKARETLKKAKFELATHIYF